MLNQTRHLAGASCGDMGVRCGVLAQNPGRLVTRPSISRLQTSLPEMRISFEHRIPREIRGHDTQRGHGIKSMDAKRIILGCNLRINPSLQGENSLQRNQRLDPLLKGPVSADPSVSLKAKGVESLSKGTLPSFYNPLQLSKSIDLLIDACKSRGISITDTWPVCVTGYQANPQVLVRRYGPGYFEKQAAETGLLSQGWRLLGLDVLDLDGLISGLKGCGFVEPMWSQLRTRLAGSLNGMGLFTELSAASQFAEVRGLEIREHAPFTVVGVLTFAAP